MHDFDPRFGNNFIDANALDSTGGAENVAMDKVLVLYEQSEFTLLLPYSVQSEIAHPNTPSEVKRKAGGLIFSMQVQLTGPELALHSKIRELIRGNAKTGQHDPDAFHLVESAKNGGRHFITNDARLLKKSAAIEEVLHLKVLKPSEFLAAYFAHAKEPLK